MPEVLTQEEAIPLAYALAQEAAAEAEVPALFIKGMANSHHGLRAPRLPADVDVLAAPDCAVLLMAQLEAWGWHRRLDRFNDFPFPHHSVTFIHDSWPCDIDVHRWFPGFLTDPNAVFEELWERRTTMTVAARDVTIPDLFGSAIIMALHATRGLRPGETSPELTQLQAVISTWSTEDLSQFAEVAGRTGSSPALVGLLDWLADYPQQHLAPIDPAALEGWRLRNAGPLTSTRGWLSFVREGDSLHERLARLRDALWPPAEAMREWGYTSQETGPNLARVRRIIRAVLTLHKRV